MALERQKHKGLQTAERLLKQGKVDEALSALGRTKVSSPGDLLALNRMSDQLARQGLNEEAIKYYFKVADEFSRSGFYPKAVAIHKKILRIEPDNVDSLVQLGNLYLQQKLPGEARRFFLHAAELSLQAQDFPLARSVYEKLIEAEPGDPRHRARLAETRAAEGDTEQAGEELILLADTLFTQGSPGDAEKSYRRAAELLPDRPEPLLGICKSIREQGREEEALGLLEQRAGEENAAPAVIGELSLAYLMGGRENEALDLLLRPGSEEIPPDPLLRAFRSQMDAGQAEALWERMDPVFEAWTERGSSARVEALFGRLGTLEDIGHVPALQRLYDLTKKTGDRIGSVRALEELVRAYQARSMTDEASLMLDRLRELAPESPLVSGQAKPAAEAEPAAETAPEAAEAPSTTTAIADESALPVEIEAPAVPLNRSDEEFVAGRLTQAEILEKYGLLDQAVQQVLEVTEKFPGHVPAQDRYVTLLRGGNERKALGEALIGLALARRAAGDAPGAREAVKEAEEIKPLDVRRREMLERLGLLQAGPAPVPEPAEQPAPRPEVLPAAEPETPAEPVLVSTPEPAAMPPAASATDAAPEPIAIQADDGGVVIDFDAMAEAEAPAAAPAPPGPPPETKQIREPGSDMLDELNLLLQGGLADEARRRVDTLRALGYASDEMRQIEAKISEALAARPIPAETPIPDDGGPDADLAAPEVEQDEEILPAAGTSSDEDDDLSAITAALESELFADDVETPVPEAQSEQSLEDVFAAFKQHVQEEVGSEDFRTHYDLGIAYKEMGLVDEAIAEFNLAVKSPDIIRQASIMLAMCHRDRQESDAAASWYRRAIDEPGGDSDSVSGLRYDLAELLIETGDLQGALQAFRDVFDSDPSYRDVRERVEQLEASSTSP